VTAIASVAPRIGGMSLPPERPLLPAAARSVPPYGALPSCCADLRSVDLHGQLAHPVNEVRAQVLRSIHDLDLEVALQDLFPQNAQL
jgi:hypothetical protein